MSFKSGHHFLQIPGPTNIPFRVLRAIDQPTVDHRGSAFSEFALGVLAHPDNAMVNAEAAE